MSNMTLRLLRARGILSGRWVFTFNQRASAVNAIKSTHLMDHAIVHVPDDPACGTYWTMDADDAQRMKAAGYKVEVEAAKPNTEVSGGR